MDFFSKDSPLARKLKNYEPREGQRVMAEAVSEVLSLERTEDGANILVVEAETGIGKTLAYLIPAAISKRKVVISTATINLQDQILDKEIPLLDKVLDQNIKVQCVKGRQNYLCHYRWNQYRYGPQFNLIDDPESEKIEKWVQQTETGDKAELTWLADRSILWSKVSSNSTQCLGNDCPEHSFCFVNSLRKKASKADILVVNHHLLFSDLALKKNGYGEVLPRYEAVVFDEAHHVENIATSYFGKSLSKYQLLDLISDCTTQAESDLSSKVLDSFLSELTGLKKRVEFFFAILPTERGRFPLRPFQEKNSEQWIDEVELLHLGLKRLKTSLDAKKNNGEIWNSFVSRCDELRGQLMEIASFDPDEEVDQAMVYWYERRERNTIIQLTPVEVAGELAKNLYSQVDACIFTSATLTSGGDFKYLKSRLGLPDNSSYHQLQSPFDYGSRTLTYVPATGWPEPSDKRFPNFLCQEILKILEATKGRALLLFTSFRSMEYVYDELEDKLAYPLLIQGAYPRQTLLKLFSEQTDSVLFAVASFWEGVDVPGESLSCVIIDKLPFEVPSDPVFKARVEKIERNGGKPFFEYQVPKAILSLRQGVGRLMRSTSDRGLIAIMDIRLFSKGYGKSFRKSLPSSPVVRSIEPVKNFFDV